MKKKLLIITAIAAQSCAFSAAPAWKPQSGYWYNDTNSVIEVALFEPGVDHWGSIKKPTFLEPYELVKMDSIIPTHISKFVNEEKYYVSFQYGKKGTKVGWYHGGSLSKRRLASLDDQYVVVFKANPSNSRELIYSIVSEKEFRAQHVKQLEAYPVPGGIQRMIGEYCMPTPEKTKAAE